ncbi:YdbL family protein [Shewanella sp. YIC-542]|uniref:YdbL family protein n=1 Tax=Shewanella mytili TaxID=3377111 RepID=UPI00398E93DC
MTNRIIILLCGLLLGFSSFAMSLQDAKHQGLVGEQQNGYLAVVKNAPGIAALVKEINAKRQAHYEKIAKQNGIAVNDVAKLAAEKAIARAEKGHMIQDNSGRWIKK